MSLNPEVPYVYNPAYHIKRGWRLQVIDTSLVTDFAAFRPGLVTIEQPSSLHQGTREFIYVQADALVHANAVVQRVDLSTTYNVEELKVASSVAQVVGVAQVEIAAGSFGWVLRKGNCTVVEGAGWGPNLPLIPDAGGTIGSAAVGTVSESGFGVVLTNTAGGAGTD